MQNFIEIQQRVFDDAKKIVLDLSAITSEQDLINKQYLVVQLQEYIHFLKISKHFENQAHEIPLQIIENQGEDYQLNINNFDNINDKYIAEEEVIFNNELNEIHESEIDHPEIFSDLLEEEAIFNNQLNKIDNNNLEIEQQTEIEIYAKADDAHQTDRIELKFEDELVEKKQQEPKELTPENHRDEYDVNRGKIQEIVHENKAFLKEEETEISQDQSEEKKFKLANIKGLKKLQELFDDDPLDNIQEKQEERNDNVGSLLKTNMAKDFMEAEKAKPEFKLDLNDRIAFSKVLFEGNEDEMNTTINKLNNCKTLEEAKEYLSEVYYQRKWEKADEYAQRLWSLVENKFI